MITVPMSAVRNDFDRYHDLALIGPIRVTQNGRETVVLLSTATYRALKPARRRALAAADLSPAEAAAIARAEIPTHARVSLADLD